MLCYRDMTFCKVPCGNIDCRRRKSPKLVNEANVFGLPLALSDFKDTDYCIGHKEPELICERCNVGYLNSESVIDFARDSCSICEKPLKVLDKS